MSKRGENIRKRKDGRWEARYTDENGKRKSVYAKSYSELKQKLKVPTEMKTEETKEINKTESTSFIKISTEWLQETEIRNKRSTVSKYSGIVKKHLQPFFNNTEITKDSVNTFILYKSTQENLHPKTVYDILTVLIQIIKYAEKAEYIQPFRYEIVRPKIPKKEVEVLTLKEQEKLVNTVKTDISFENIGILLSLYSGLRLGEICALKWEDINMKEGTVSITKTMQRIQCKDKKSKNKTEIIIDVPKSQNSIRTIPIPQFLFSDLKTLSEKCTCNSYILTGTEDRFIEPRTYQYKFKKYLEKSELRDINFHALRHTFATRAIEKNMDVKVLSEILGHATITFTLETYVHISLDFKKQNMEKLSVCY